ncbi:hypothetical protein [Xanthomonas arboricola]
MTTPLEPHDAITDGEDDYCPECFGDDVIELPNGDLFCKECRAIIDY